MNINIKSFIIISALISFVILITLSIFGSSKIDKIDKIDNTNSLTGSPLTTTNDSLVIENQRLDSLYHITLKKLTSIEEYTNILESDNKVLKDKLTKCNHANNLLQLTEPTITDVRKRVEVTLIDSIVYDTVFLRPFNPDPHNYIDTIR